MSSELGQGKTITRQNDPAPPLITTHASLLTPRQSLRAALHHSSMSDAFHTPNTVDPRLLEVLVCPVTRGPLTYDRDANDLVSKGAKLAFPIREGVPIMLAEEARQID